MMDLSLLTANANQLKFILYYNKDAKTFYPALVLIILSLILQIAVGILLIFRVSRVYIKHNPCGSSTKCFKNLTRIWVLMSVCVYVYLTETIKIKWTKAACEHNKWIFSALDISDNFNKHIGGSFQSRWECWKATMIKRCLPRVVIRLMPFLSYFLFFLCGWK